MEKISSAVVIGTGMMGPGIAAVIASAGIPVAIASRTVENAATGLTKAKQCVDLLLQRGLADADRVGSISSSADLQPLIASAALVVESGPEDMRLKQDLFAFLDRIAPPSAILASNTSGLRITEIASRCRFPERVLTAHFWNPPHLMPLVEIVMGECTAPQFVSAMVELLRSCGKQPVVVHKDRPGQLGNRLQMALLREACAIVEEGIASVEDVDLAAKTGFGLRLPVYGIFEHQDAVGLDMGLGILDYIARDLYNEPRAPDLYRDKVAAGKLGAKTGEGFYDWNVRSIDDLKRKRDAFVLDVITRQRS